jgi:hypothetical protein
MTGYWLTRPATAPSHDLGVLLRRFVRRKQSSWEPSASDCRRGPASTLRFAFEENGAYELKGVSGGRTLYALTY